MTSPVDPDALRIAIGHARKQRAQLRRNTPVAPDTAHLIMRPGDASVLDVAMIRFPDSPYDGPSGKPRYRTMRELGEHLAVVAAQSLTTEDDEPRAVVAIWFGHAVSGTGAELVAEAVQDESGKFQWTISRAPADGAPIAIGNDFDDAVFEKHFGRPLTLAKVWSELLARAEKGEASLHQVEPGYMIYAGPQNSADLKQKLIDLGNRDGDWVRAIIGAPDRTSLATLEPGFRQWAAEWSEAIAEGRIQIGAAIDRARALEHLQSIVEWRGFEWIEHPKDHSLFASSGEASWPLDPGLLAAAAVHLGRTLTEGAVTFVSAVEMNLKAIDKFLAAVREARPGRPVTVDGMTAQMTRADATRGEPINLEVVPFQAPPGSAEFERELRFACDPLPNASDPTQVCTCGADAHAVAHIVRWTEELEEAKGFKPLERFVSVRWPEEKTLAAVMMGIQCELHLRYPLMVEFERAGYTVADLEAAVHRNVSDCRFEIDATTNTDSAGKRALIAHGKAVASAALNDGLLAALHETAGRVLRGPNVGVMAIVPDGLCLFEAGTDAELLRTLADRLHQLHDDGATTEPLTLRWSDVNLSAVPVGRFESFRRRVASVPNEGGAMGMSRRVPPTFGDE